MHRNSGLLFEKYAKSVFRSGMRVLEIGPDGAPSTYQRIVGDASIDWRTLDIDPTATFVGVTKDQLSYVSTDEYRFPIEDNAFDIVLSGQVIEHVKKIWRWMPELARICKPGGLVITINPVSWGYHEAPVDCWRIYPEGIRALHEDAGLKTQLAVFESLDPRVELSPFYLFKQAFKTLVGKKPYVLPEWLSAVDTVSIGQKP